MKYNEQSALESFVKPGADHYDAALAYAALGIHVLPLANGSKEPLRGSHAVHDASTNREQIERWWSENPLANIGIGLRNSCVVILDVDPRNGGNQTLDHWEERFGLLPSTYTVKTANDGLHYYYRVPPDFYETIADRLPKKLGKGLEFLVNGYAVAPPSTLVGGRTYEIAESIPESRFARCPIVWIQKVAAESGAERDRALWQEDENWRFEVGERNVGMAKLAGYLRRVGFTAEEIFSMLKVVGPTRIADFQEIDDKEIWQTARSIANNPPSGIRLNEVSLTIIGRRQEPEFDRSALLGPIGEWIEFIEPITEASTPALLFQALAVFGNMIGAQRHGEVAPGFAVEGAYHRTNLYVLVVGATAKAGKGDSWSRVWELMSSIDPIYRHLSGVQTGEGIIEYLVDDEPDGNILNLKSGDTVGVTKGVTKGSRNDRRCLVYEPEFGRVLHVSERRGSVIKDILRDLWDRGDTGKVTASSRQRVTEATFSLVGHITKPELERDFDATDFMNGFGNRFIYCHAKRSKRLALGKARSLTEKELQIFGDPLREAIQFAQQEAPEIYEFTEEATRVWNEDIDRLLDKTHTSMVVDALAARGRPIVRRLAVIYAVSECSAVVKVRHLRAAYTLWQYCVDTAEYLFSNHIGDKYANRLMQAMLENPAGLTNAEISRRVFQGNLSADAVKHSIKVLRDRGILFSRKEKSGRKTTEVFFIKPDFV